MWAIVKFDVQPANLMDKLLTARSKEQATRQQCEILAQSYELRFSVKFTKLPQLDTIIFPLPSGTPFILRAAFMIGWFGLRWKE
jgi:hypothetical protein